MRPAATAVLALLVSAVLESGCISVSAAQSDVFLGQWAAAEPDRGVVVVLTFGTPSTLVLPGTGPSGRVEALTLSVRNFQQRERSATFSVDLPDNEGSLDLEFGIDSTGGLGVLTVRRIDGEPADNDAPVWKLRRQRQR